MQPAIPAGALVFVDTSLSETPQVDDVVLFRTAEQQADVVHRIIGVDVVDGQPVFSTQGDANADPDQVPLVTADILGQVRWSIPWLGHVMTSVQGNRTAALLLAIPAIVIILMELPLWYRFVRYGREAFEPADDHLGTIGASEASAPSRQGSERTPSTVTSS